VIPLTTSRIDYLRESMTAKGLRLSLAESCTGGMIASEITTLSGSSAFFLGSAVTYSNESKENILGVSHSSLIEFGAVSEAVAKEMALGSLRAYGSDIAGSVTGIAGPDGGTLQKPVGTVWMAVTDGKRTIAYENHFEGSRKDIREQTVRVLIERLIEFIH